MGADCKLNNFEIRQETRESQPEFYLNGNIIEDIISVEYKFVPGEVTEFNTGDGMKIIAEDCVLKVVVKYWVDSIEVTNEFTNVYKENE